MPALYTPDAVLSDESEMTHAGQAAIARAFAQGTPPGSTIDIRSSGAIGSGDLIVDMGNYTFRMPNPQGGPAVSMNGRYLVVLQRLDDGSWKIARQMTDVVGIGGAMPAGPPTDSAAAGAGAPQPAESGFSDPN
jgi:ketosteroid isomerase-like protein